MKKLLAICLSVLLLCAAIPFSFAAADEAATLVVSDVEGKAGDEVSVTVSLKNNPGLVSAKVKLNYDTSVLELTAKEAGEFPGSGYSWGAMNKDFFVINFCDAIAEADYTYELLATLTFKIKDGAAAGNYPFTLECDYEGDFYNLAWDVIEFAEVPGSVTVKGDEPVTPPSTPAVPEMPAFTAPTVAIPYVGAAAGDEISVPVYIKNNPGLVSAKIKLNYDTTALELIDKAAGEFPGSGYSWGAMNKDFFVINFCDAIASEDYTYELLATLTFKVKDTAAAGEYAFTIECDYEGDFYNLAWDVLEFDEYVGAVVIAGDEPVTPPTPPVCEHEYDAACDPTCNLCGETRPVHTEGIVHFDAVAPACHYNGNIEYWFCPACECFWADAALTQLTNSKSVILPATGGEVAHIDAVAPACHYNGNVEYWVCYECEQFWVDAALTQISNSKSVILPATGGDVIHVEAVAPTCQSEGNIEYWYCEQCEQVWQDAALTQLTNHKNVILGLGEHNIVHMDAVEPGCHYVGNIEYWFCTTCESVWQDEALTQLTNRKNVILPAIGGDVEHIEALEPTCNSLGNIEYWHCASCDQYWQDEALTQLTNRKNVLIGTLDHTLVHVEAVAPTCQSEGNIEHWYCSVCEIFWQDAELTQITNSKNVKLGVTDHNVVHFDAVEAGCHYIGNIEYWYCTTCEIFWQDAELTQITNSKNVIVPAKGGDVIFFEAIEPACHYNGRIAYWFCPECEQFWQDEALTQLTNSKNVILPAIGSENLQHVEALAPTCSDAGNIEYWFCPDCEQFWQDEALTQLTNSKNVVLAPIDHTIVHMDAVEAGCHMIGNIEYWYCSACAMFWQDEALTQLTNSKNVIVPAKGGDVIAFEAIEPGCHYNGRIAYWFCDECDQFWADEALTQLTNSKNVIVPAKGGEVKHVEAKEPTATENGNIEHWFCEECEQFWADEALTQITNSKNVILAATGTQSPETGDSTVAVVIALLTMVASGAAVVLFKNKKHA